MKEKRKNEDSEYCSENKIARNFHKKFLWLSLSDLFIAFLRLSSFTIFGDISVYVSIFIFYFLLSFHATILMSYSFCFDLITQIVLFLLFQNIIIIFGNARFGHAGRDSSVGALVLPELSSLHQASAPRKTENIRQIRGSL
jgi:hypothetical protein